MLNKFLLKKKPVGWSVWIAASWNSSTTNSVLWISSSKADYHLPKDCGFGNAVCEGGCSPANFPAYGLTGFAFSDAQVYEGTESTCNRVCLPNGNMFNCVQLDLDDRGECKACNGHGTCTSYDMCICYRNWIIQ